MFPAMSSSGKSSEKCQVTREVGGKCVFSLEAGFDRDCGSGNEKSKCNWKSVMPSSCLTFSSNRQVGAIYCFTHWAQALVVSMNKLTQII